MKEMSVKMNEMNRWTNKRAQLSKEQKKKTKNLLWLLYAQAHKHIAFLRRSQMKDVNEYMIGTNSKKQNFEKKRKI